MATETAQLAQACGDPDVAEAYMGMAKVWVKMAEEARARALAEGEDGRRGDRDTATGTDDGPAIVR